MSDGEEEKFVLREETWNEKMELTAGVAVHCSLPLWETWTSNVGNGRPGKVYSKKWKRRTWNKGSLLNTSQHEYPLT